MIKAQWPGDLSALNRFLSQNQYKKISNNHWTRGSFFDFHPEAIAHDLRLREEQGQVTIEAIPRNRLLLDRYDKKCLELFYQNFHQGKINSVRAFDSSSISGLLFHGFYELSAFFLGLLGVLLFLWVSLSQKLPDLVYASAIRLRTYELIAQGMGFPSFPDSYWVQRGHIDSIQPAAMILAFVLTFPVALGSLVGLITANSLPGRGFLVPILTALWSLFLVAGNFFLGGPWQDIWIWLLAPWCVLPGYLVVTAIRRPYVTRGCSLGSWGSLQVSLGLMLVLGVTIISPVALPIKKEHRLPDFFEPEGLLAIRDEILWTHPVGRWISDHYYNNVVLSNFYLRPPLASTWPDNTVLFMGDNSQIRDYFVSQDILLLPIKNDDSGWQTIQQGLYDSQMQQFLGSTGFEMLLVQKSLISNDFWPRLARENPWLLKRTGVYDGVRIENPYLQTELKDIVDQQRPAQNMSEALEQLMFAIQTACDTTAFREELFATGRLLLFGGGVPLLVLWALNGLGALVMGIFLKGSRQWVGYATLGALVWGCWPAPLTSQENQLLKKSQVYRSELTGAFGELENMSANWSSGNENFKDRLELYRTTLENYWSEEFYLEISRMSQSSNALTRARALASVDRLCRSVLKLHELYQVLGENYLPPHIKNWQNFQKQDLIYLVEDSDPLVAYWALQVAGFAYPDNATLWRAVCRQLQSSHVNVQDKAVLAIQGSPHESTLVKLKDHYLDTWGQETCDYVRLHTYWTLLKNRAAFIYQEAQ